MAILLLAAIALAGCGSGGGSSTVGLMQALASVKATPISRTYLAWSDLAATRRLAGLPARIAQLAKTKLNGRWASVVGIGTDDLAVGGPEFIARTTINLLAADQAIQIGGGANGATRIDGPGIDAATITHSLQGLGAKQVSIAGQPFLALGAQGSVNTNNPLVALGVTDQLDRSVVRGHTLIAGSAVAPVVALLGGSPSLAADPADRAAAGCLGNVITAEIATPAALGAAGSAAELVGIGDQRPKSASAPVTEILCMIDSSSNAAGGQIARLHAVLGSSGVIPQVGVRWSSVVRSAQVTQSTADNLTVIRTAVNLRPSQDAGFLNNLETREGLGDLTGGATRKF